MWCPKTALTSGRYFLCLWSKVSSERRLSVAVCNTMKSTPSTKFASAPSLCQEQDRLFAHFRIRLNAYYKALAILLKVVGVDEASALTQVKFAECIAARTALFKNTNGNMVAGSLKKALPDHAPAHKNSRHATA